MLDSKDEDPQPTIENVLSHPDYNGNSQQKAIDRNRMCENEASGPRPMTCFLYEGLTTNQLRTFLLDRRACAACIRHHLTLLEEMTSRRTEKLTPARPKASVHSLDSVHVGNEQQSHLFDFTILTPRRRTRPQ